MNSEIKSILLILVMSLSVFTKAAIYDGGTGTAGDPYQIRTSEQLNSIGLNTIDWSKHFKLMADINMSAYTATQYNVIGNLSTPFTGTFDGQGHVISNLTYVSTSSVNCIGTFGYIRNATIQNLGIENINLSGNDCVGGLVGQNDSSTLSGCYTTGLVQGRNRVGGIAGVNHGFPTACHTSSSVIAAGSYAGGFAGKNYQPLTACYATGAVRGNDNVGGLIGLNDSSTLSGCFATGAVRGNYYVGGLVGQNIQSPLSSCYATGAVGEATDTSFCIGGLVGLNESSTITTCYSTGSVSSNGSYIGGLIGDNWGTAEASACFWDIQTSGRTISDGGTGKTTSQMQTQSTFVNAGWDFTDTDGDPAEWWLQDNDYPRLEWETAYGGGSGTTENPYQIRTPQQMNAIGTAPQDWASHFVLMADLDMSDYSGTQYNIIGNAVTPFTGSFNGGGHVLSNLSYTTLSAVDYAGVFGYIQNAAIRNLIIENITLASGGRNIGGLVGWNESSSVSNSYVSGTISGIGHVGGLAGRNNLGQVSTCHSAAWVGGTTVIGGLVGGNYSGTFGDSSATGRVSGTGNYVGGLTGYNNKGTIKACYVAGLIGNTGTYVGGLAGWNSTGSTVTACFWNTQTSGTSQGVGGGLSNGMEGKTTTQMRMLSTFTSAGWDFTNETTNGTLDFWRMCSNGVDYPQQNWLSMTGDFACPDGVGVEDLSDYTAWWLMEDCTAANNFCGGADLNYDGITDMNDFALFAGHWMQSE